jgi:hypothetical protein
MGHPQLWSGQRKLQHASPFIPSLTNLPQASQPLLMTQRAGSVRSPLKPKTGLNGPPEALVAGAESFFSQLAAGKSATRDDKSEGGFLPLLWLAGRTKQQVPPLRSPRFPVDIVGVGKIHAAFFKENRIRCPLRFRVAGNPGTLR